MAFSVRFTGYTQGVKSKLLDLEIPWWDVDALREDSRFVVSNQGGYWDYNANLSCEEARALHEQFKPRATRGVYEYGGWQKIIQPMLKELDSAFALPKSHFSHFHVSVFEWESGLDDLG